MQPRPVIQLPERLGDAGGAPPDVPRRDPSRSGQACAALPGTVARAAYIHVPFCAHRCGYCNFTLIAGRDDLFETYLAALEEELSHLGKPREVDTLFLGGGTPTHLPPALLARVLTLAQTWFPLAAGAEFSVEANPRDITPQRVEVLAAAGVTRISLGAQSLGQAKLKALDRDHAPDDVRTACELLRPLGCELALDLIFAAPGETLSDWQHDLAGVIELCPDHVSTYGLTYERGTAFYAALEHSRLRACAEELEREMYLVARERLTAAGLEHYEVSNFARSGRRCRHNEVYWTAHEYWGVGPGAARYLDGRRSVNHRSTTTWIRRVLAGQSPVAECEMLGPEDRAREALVLGLRRLEGIDEAEFLARFGFAAETLGGERLVRYLADGALKREGRRLRLTLEGLLISDALWPALLRP